ncbi:VOC family protein [Mycolicibacterium sp. ND9-15]|uniref:VOC family protein n=1 Tax=Mycolicibacterium sp. ND9-15 TaxID=3042320 RepID=UPI002DD92676|nr:VOC family protein [Mycolicibacterium sp. ND9-15]WSE55518.1 VOC family protein [Mycolicibacterium sp. ND9-15]
MTTDEGPLQLHHVVFAVAPERQAAMAALFTELGFTFDEAELTELGVRVHLDWNRGIELVSPVPGSTASVATTVNEFLGRQGDGVYTVVVRVPDASAAEAVAQRYGSRTRFRQGFSGEGTFLDEIDLSVLGLPLTFLATNVP